MKRLLLLLIIIAGLAVGLFAAYQPGSVNFIIGDYWIQIPLWLFLAGIVMVLLLIAAIFQFFRFFIIKPRQVRRWWHQRRLQQLQNQMAETLEASVLRHDKRVIKLAPKVMAEIPCMHYLYWKSLIHQQHWSELTKILEQSETSHPGMVSLFKGLMAYKQKDYDLAIDHLKQAQKKLGKKPIIVQLLQECHDSQKDQISIQTPSNNEANSNPSDSLDHQPTNIEQANNNETSESNLNDDTLPLKAEIDIISQQLQSAGSKRALMKQWKKLDPKWQATTQIRCTYLNQLIDYQAISKMQNLASLWLAETGELTFLFLWAKTITTQKDKSTLLNWAMEQKSCLPVAVQLRLMQYAARWEWWDWLNDALCWNQLDQFNDQQLMTYQALYAKLSEAQGRYQQADALNQALCGMVLNQEVCGND